MINARKLLFPIVSILFGLFISIVLLEILFRFLPVRDSLMPLPVNASNPVIRFMQNRDVVWSKGPDFSIVTRKHVNNYGFLNDQDYAAGETLPLMAVIGDSYVEASMVDNQNTLHGLLAREIEDKGRIYSFGASGSPLSTYLAYARYAVDEFNANALVFIIVGNDFDESLIKYKDAPGFHYFSNDPADTKLIRKDYQPTLVKRLSRHSALVRYLAYNLKLSKGFVYRMFNNQKLDQKYVGNTRADFDDARIADSESAVQRFFKALPEMTGLENDRILFVVDGMRPDLYSPVTLMKARGSYFDLMRQYFISTAKVKGYEVVDMQPVFVNKYRTDGSRFEFATDAHWNELGHSLAAEQIKASAVFSRLYQD